MLLGSSSATEDLTVNEPREEYISLLGKFCRRRAKSSQWLSRTCSTIARAVFAAQITELWNVQINVLLMISTSLVQS